VENFGVDVGETDVNGGTLRMPAIFATLISLLTAGSRPWAQEDTRPTDKRPEIHPVRVLRIVHRSQLERALENL